MCQRKTKQMREFEPILKANGYREIRSNGSHFIYSNGTKVISRTEHICLIRQNFRRLIDMEFKSAIVDELGCVMYWCDELQDEDQIECILNSHPEWNRKCIEM